MIGPIKVLIKGNTKKIKFLYIFYIVLLFTIIFEIKELIFFSEL